VVKKSVLDRFVKLGGYAIVRRRKENGKWQGISEASKKTSLSRPTIYAILKEHPNPPNKTLPQYVEEFEESEGYRLLKDLYEKTLSRCEWLATKKDVMDGWKLLNKKDPISWNEKDFRKIWNAEIFIDPIAGGFEEHHGTKFRRLMRAINKHDLLERFHSKKRPAGIKKEWFLYDEEIIRLVSKIENPDVLVFVMRGIVEGGRSSALLEGKPEHLNPKDNTIVVFESKTKEYITKVVQPCVMELLQKYVRDYKLRHDDPLFPKEYNYYNNALKKAGKKAGIKKAVTTHILKHTFISQAHRHGVSAETVVDQTGTELRTIIKYYRAKDENKIRHELLGEQYNPAPFPRWVESLAPYFEQKYENLNGTL